MFVSRPRRQAALLAVSALIAAPFLAGPALAGPVRTRVPAPTYQAYDLGVASGEPGVSYDPHARAAMYTSDIDTMRLTWDDRVSPPRIAITHVSPPTSATSLDPIIFVDPLTHRTFVSQLLGACSLTSFSDNAGESWTPSQGCGPGVLLDHQSVGGGPYPPGFPTAGLTGYPDAVYYCAQNSYSGACARSDDGGRTFGPGVPTYNTPAQGVPYGGACSAIHGHIRVSLQGVAYLPNKGCGGTPTVQNLTNSEFFGGSPAVVVSEDAGLTWSVRPVPGAHNPDESDPSVDTDRSGTVFFGWQDGVNPSETVYGTTSSARIATSHDHGRTWSKPVDVSTPLGIHNVQFPEVIAGDAGRAAFAFIGTPGIGDDQHKGFVGEWHLYVATTIDGGRTYQTVDATPRNPLQRGCISLQGTSNKTVADKNICDQRDLLDFNDITLDEAGRVIVAYSDGCAGNCVSGTLAKVNPEDYVLRQVSGPRLRAAASQPARHPVSPAHPQVPVRPLVSPHALPSTPTGLLAATGTSPVLPAGALVFVLAALALRRSRSA